MANEADTFRKYVVPKLQAAGWESGWPKLKLAEKFGCSTSTIDKALAWAYEQDGMPMPSRADRRSARVSMARALLEEGRSLDEIAETLKGSDVTARAYLRESFAAEGKAMPDLRGEPRRPQ